MKKNVGTADRAIRGIVGIAAVAAYGMGILGGALGVAALVIGIVMITTAAVGWCPPYTLLGINTRGSAK